MRSGWSRRSGRSGRSGPLAAAPAPGPATAHAARLRDLPGERARHEVVHAITAKGNLPGHRLIYNEKFELFDPDAILFVRAEDLPDLRAGLRAPEPLILRAAADCIQVTLVNELPFVLPKTPHFNYSPPIIEGFNTNQVRPSNHVSLHPQLVTYDVKTDDGANVGFNEPQTIAPGELREYTWYAGEFAQLDGMSGPIEPRTS
ncbi:hypothetical protein BE20_03840 [Sorangium cellulosum]|nr:hypothetical protein BE20_03840 [Sorangium cellulosum]